MHNRLNVVFPALIFLISSCASPMVKGTRNLTGNSVVFSEFPVNDTIETKKYIALQKETPDRLHLYEDSTLLIVNIINNNSHFFSLYNTTQQSFIKKYLKYGGKKGSSLGFMSFGTYNKMLWVNDVMKKKVLITNIDTVLGDIDAILQEKRIPTFYYSSELLNDSILLCSGDYESEYKLIKRNIVSGEIEKNLFKYDADSTVTWNMSKKTAYESFLFLRPSRDKCALAARYADRIEIFDLANETSKIIKGPKNFEPNVTEMVNNDGFTISTRDNNTIFAFVRGKATDKYLYLLYSGNKDLTIHRDYGKYIYVYDWQGNPVKKITLKDYIVDFAVTHDDTIIYTYSPRSKYIDHANL